jgi:hypothetical protein
MDDRYRQIIFIDGPETIGDGIRNNDRVFFTEIDGAGFSEIWPGYELCTRLGLKESEDGWVEFLNGSIDGFTLASNFDIKYDSIYVSISNVDRILEHPYYQYTRIEFFGTLNDVKNERVFFLVGRSQKTYVMEQINNYLVHIKNREVLKKNTKVGVRGQMLFVDSLENVNLEKDDFFKIMDGEHFSNEDYLYNDFMIQLGFPHWFGRNMAALEDCLTDPESYWSRALEGQGPHTYIYLFFLYIKNAKNILPKNDWQRAVFFSIMDDMCQRVFIVFDKSDKDFVLGEIGRYREIRDSKRRVRLEEEKKNREDRGIKEEQNSKMGSDTFSPLEGKKIQKMGYNVTNDSNEENNKYMVEETLDEETLRRIKDVIEKAKKNDFKQIRRGKYSEKIYKNRDCRLPEDGNYVEFIP